MEKTTKSRIVKIINLLQLARKKLRALICIALVAAILSTGLVIIKSVFFGTYGAEITFYISPASNAYSLLSLLESDSFFEKLLLDENGLPPRELCDSQKYEEALSAVTAAREARAAKYEAVKRHAAIPYEFAKISETYNDLCEVYGEAYGLLDMYKTAYDNVVDDEDHNKRLAEYERQVDVAASAKNEYKINVYYPALLEKLEAEETLYKATELVKETQKSEQTLVNSLLESWRANTETKKAVENIRKHVDFTYETRQIREGTSSAEAYDTPFIKATVSIPGDEEFSELLVNNIKSYTPEFVVRNMEKWTGTVEAECTLISTFSENKNLELEDITFELTLSPFVTVFLSCTIALLIFWKKEKNFSLDGFKEKLKKEIDS